MGALDVFSPAPSKEEAIEAVYDIQMISLPTVTSHFAGDKAGFFTEDAVNGAPLLHEKLKMKSLSVFDGCQVYKLSSVLSQAPKRFLEALRLLWIDSSVKNMVISLSTDKNVWNAVLKNELVQEFKKTYHADKYLKHMEHATKWSDAAGPGITARILSWFLGFAEAVAKKFLGDIISLVNKFFDQKVMEDSADILSELVSSSFMLSILVFIIVIMKRILISIAS